MDDIKSSEKPKAQNPSHKVGIATVVSRGGREASHLSSTSKTHETCGADSPREKPFITDGGRGIMEKSPYYSKPSLTSHSKGRLKKEPGHHYYRTPSSKTGMESKSLVATGNIEDSTAKRGATTTYKVQNEMDSSAAKKGELLDVDCHDLKGREEMVLSPGDDEGMIDNSETALSGDLNWSVISSSTRVTAGMKSWASLHPSEPMIMTSNKRKVKDQAVPEEAAAPSEEVNKTYQPSPRTTRSVAQTMTLHLTSPAVSLWGDVEERRRLRNNDGSTRCPPEQRHSSSSLSKLRNLRANANKITWMKLWFQQIQLSCRRMVRKNQDTLFLSNYITNIEGRFGSGLAAFFIFVRHLLLMDVALSLLWAALIILPQAMHTDYTPIKDNFYFKNLLDGQNGMASSWFFYGNYKSEVARYPLALIYMVVVILTYFGGLFVVLKSVAYAIHDEGGSSVKDTRYVFSRLVLGSWDYALRSREAVKTFSRGLKSILQDEMSEMKTKEAVESRTKTGKCLIISGRILAWIISTLLVVGGCAAIYFASSPDTLTAILEKMGYGEARRRDNVVVVFGPTVIFMVVNSVIPMCLYQLPKMEKYAHPKTTLHVNIGRVFVLQIANLVSLVVSTYNNTDETLNGCRGTLIGQQLYKLVILNTIFGALQTLIPWLLMYFWRKKKTEFQMAPVILSVIQRQALVWIGTLVCPIMPLLGVITMATMFFTNYARISVTCQVPKQRWNQARRNSFLMGLTAFTLFLILIPVSIIITRQDVITLGYIGGQESSCGPFSNQSMIQVAVAYQQSEASFLAQVMEIVFSATIILPVVLIMIALIYFQSLRVKWEKSRKKTLLAELMQEREECQKMKKKLHSVLNIPPE